MNTVTVQHAFEQAMWQDDEPVLCFDAPHDCNVVHDEHLVHEMFQAGEGYLARCCLCGGQFALNADDTLKVYAWGTA